MIFQLFTSRFESLICEYPEICRLHDNGVPMFEMSATSSIRPVGIDVKSPNAWILFQLSRHSQHRHLSKTINVPIQAIAILFRILGLQSADPDVPNWERTHILHNFLRTLKSTVQFEFAVYSLIADRATNCSLHFTDRNQHDRTQKNQRGSTSNATVMSEL